MGTHWHWDSLPKAVVRACTAAVLAWVGPLVALAAVPVVMAMRSTACALAMQPSPSAPCRAMLAEMAEPRTAPEVVVVARVLLAKTA